MSWDNDELKAMFVDDFNTVIDLEGPADYILLDEGGVEQTRVHIANSLFRGATEQTATEYSLVAKGGELKATSDLQIAHILFDSIPGIRPAMGHVLLDLQTGIRWVIWKIELQTADERYRLSCYRE